MYCESCSYYINWRRNPVEIQRRMTSFVSNPSASFFLSFVYLVPLYHSFLLYFFLSFFSTFEQLTELQPLFHVMWKSREIGKKSLWIAVLWPLHGIHWRPASFLRTFWLNRAVSFEERFREVRVREQASKQAWKHQSKHATNRVLCNTDSPARTSPGSHLGGGT
jgi:hypothetical protein